MNPTPERQRDRLLKMFLCSIVIVVLLMLLWRSRQGIQNLYQNVKVFLQGLAAPVGQRLLDEEMRQKDEIMRQQDKMFEKLDRKRRQQESDADEDRE